MMLGNSKIICDDGLDVAQLTDNELQAIIDSDERERNWLS
jgi:hypothetical protein